MLEAGALMRLLENQGKAIRRKKMTCPKCASSMYRTNLIYETNGVNNFSVLGDTPYFKCPICGFIQFVNVGRKKKVFVKGQKIKDVPVDLD